VSLMTAKPPLAPKSLPCPPTRAAVRRSAARGRLAVPARVPAQIVKAINNQLICLGARFNLMRLHNHDLSKRQYLQAEGQTKR
jgi:hypothetical protein